MLVKRSEKLTKLTIKAKVDDIFPSSEKNHV